MLQDEIYDDSIIPFLKKELNRTVNLHGNVVLGGAIYCQNLEVFGGNIFVKKSVYAEEALTIKGEEGGMVWFNSPVNAEHSILVDEKCEMRVRFGKTVRSQSINLYNTIVYGNVIADNVTLKNSVVLGGVFASKKLQVDNSIVGTYHTPQLMHFNNMGLLYPMAVSDQKPELSEKIWMVVPGSAETGNPGGLYKLGKEDFYPVSLDGEKKYMFSNTMRIFDLRAFYMNMQESIERLFNSSAENIEEIDTARENFSQFDARYFVFIENQFKTSKKKTWSDFMELDQEVIDEYFGLAREDDKKEAGEIDREGEMTEEHEHENVTVVDALKEMETAAEEESDEALKTQRTETSTTNAEIAYANTDALGVEESAEDQPAVEETPEIKNVCPNCDTENEDSYVFCSECGYKIKNE